MNAQRKLVTALWPLAFISAPLIFMGVAQAQVSPEAAAAAQARYDREMAVCNSGTLPAPQRDACVRSAGEALDRARGGPPVPVENTTTDGRATVMTPQAPPVSTPPGPGPSTSESLRITPDGRATVVPSTDGSGVRGTVPQ